VAYALQTFAGLNAIAETLGMPERAESMAYVVSEGRLFELRPSDWSVLLVGAIFSAMLVLLI